MLRITAGNRRLCDGLSRRDLLRVGGAGLLGLCLPDLLRTAIPGRARAKALIVMFLEGGPTHQDPWDTTPEAHGGTVLFADAGLRSGAISGAKQPIGYTAPSSSSAANRPSPKWLAYPRQIGPVTSVSKRSRNSPHGR